jgi:formylglycine-generating enzyme required for sulfatase activity
MHAALDEDNVPEAQRHAEHVINLLDGKDGFTYGDLNRDGQAQNPGDGYGIRAYLDDARTLATEGATSNSSTETATQQRTLQEMVTAIEDGQAFVPTAIDKSLQIFAADTDTEAQKFADELGVLIAQIEDAIREAYTAGLLLVEYQFHEPALRLVPTAIRAPTLQPAPTLAPTPVFVATTVTQKVTSTVHLTHVTASLPGLPAVTGAPARPSSAAPVAPPPAGAIGDTWENPVDGAVYVYVPGGRFIIGVEKAQAVSVREQPPAEVEVAGFWLQQTEVTNAQYASCVAAEVCTAPANERWQAEEYADHPVTGVNWQQAKEYANWVGGRLPSEAEWERACRGDDGRLFPWGEQAPTPTLSNYNNLVGETTAVGSYPDGASPYGLLDLSGNVWEWTSSLDIGYPYAAHDGREEASAAGKRIVRGGSFYYTQYQLRCVARTGFDPTTAADQFGLRVAQSPPSEAAGASNP